VIVTASSAITPSSPVPSSREFSPMRGWYRDEAKVACVAREASRIVGREDLRREIRNVPIPKWT